MHSHLAQLTYAVQKRDYPTSPDCWPALTLLSHHGWSRLLLISSLWGDMTATLQTFWLVGSHFFQIWHAAISKFIVYRVSCIHVKSTYLCRSNLTVLEHSSSNREGTVLEHSPNGAQTRGRLWAWAQYGCECPLASIERWGVGLLCPLLATIKTWINDVDF